jgi:nucleoside-diphosphate-sugar epimerase
VEHPLKDLDVNGGGTLRVLMAAVQAKAERVVFASAGCAADHIDTPYQITKRLGEMYMNYFSDQVPTVVCRFHNSFGPGECPGQWRNVVPNWIWKAIHNETLTIFGDGSDARDFIYVDDLVQRMMDAKAGPEPHVLGTGTLTKTIDLAKMIIDLTGSKSEVIHAPRRRWDHAGTASYQHGGSTRLEVGLRKTIAWFKGPDYENIRRSVR